MIAPSWLVSRPCAPLGCANARVSLIDFDLRQRWDYGACVMMRLRQYCVSDPFSSLITFVLLITADMWHVYQLARGTTAHHAFAQARD